MSPLKTSLIVGLLSGVITAGGFFYVQQGRVRELQRLQAQNNRMRLDAYQRVKASGANAEPAVAKRGSESKATAAIPPVAATPAPSPVEYYRNEGNATPLAALQTFAWACDRGDVETVGRLILIDESARPKVEAFMTSLPDNVRAQWKTADEMAAAILTESVMARPFPNADILETATPEPVGHDRVKMRLPNVPKDGTVYQKTAQGWKYVITEAAVDSYLRHVAEQAKAAH